LLLLDCRVVVLLPTLYALRLDRTSDRTYSGGIQNCGDRLVMVARSADS